MEARDVLRPDAKSVVQRGFRLLTLGTVTVVDENGAAEPILSRRRRKLAVLAFLALEGRPVGRDRLSEMFWGDEDDSRARHSLADSLSNLRRVLGVDALATRQFEIALAPHCPLAVDVLELIEAHDRRDFARVIDLYRGPFLDGLSIPGSASFDHWVARVRDRVDRYWMDACSHQCLTLARARRWTECAAVARRWLASRPLNTDAALYLINALKAPATAESYAVALAEYDHIAQRLARELGCMPADEVILLAASIRDHVGHASSDGGVRAEPLDTSAPPAAPEKREPDTPAKVRRDPRAALSRIASLAVVTVLFMTSTSFTAVHAGATAAGMGRPIVAVLGIRTVDRDSASAWLERVIPQLVVSQVSRVPGIDAVASDFVHEARVATGLTHDRELSISETNLLGRRVGARWVASGRVQRRDGVYVLDLVVHEVGSTSRERVVRVSHAEIIALADQAGSMVASIASPRLNR